jgi:anthranilate synthase component 1
MSQFNHNNLSGSVNTLTISANYQADPLALYQLLCHNKANNLLLESAEIDKKQQLKSILLTHSALRIECHGLKVSFTPLTLNGQSILNFVEQQLKDQPLALMERTDEQLAVEFLPSQVELDEKARLKTSNPFQGLRLFEQVNNNDNHPLAVFLGGCFAFDMMAIAEQLPVVGTGENSCPDFVYYLAENLIVIDHEKRSTEIIANVFSGEHQQKYYFEQRRRLSELKEQLEQKIAPLPKAELTGSTSESIEVNVDISDSEFCAQVEKLKEHICKGDIFQVVPSRTFSLPCKTPLHAYQVLKQTNPSPYMFYLKDQDFCLFGASPESALKFSPDNRQVELYPIAGTRPRGFNAQGQYSADLDSRIELDLRCDEKEKAEHLMLVDLARNDIARVSTPGSRYVADLLKVDRYSHVMHLVSRVCGTLAEDLDALHAYQACMNMGTLSGAPKVRATELIRNVEGKRRGSYGGAVGYLTGSGVMDTCIVIRSAFVNNGIAYVQAGAGVVFDSIPQAEADETRQKATAVINAVKLGGQQSMQELS